MPWLVEIMSRRARRNPTSAASTPTTTDNNDSSSSDKSNGPGRSDKMQSSGSPTSPTTNNQTTPCTTNNNEDGEEDPPEYRQVPATLPANAQRPVKECRRCRRAFYHPILDSDPEHVRICGWHHPGEAKLLTGIVLAGGGDYDEARRLAPRYKMDTAAFDRTGYLRDYVLRD